MAAARPWRRGTEAMAHAHVVGESGSGGRVIQNKPFSRVRRPLMQLQDRAEPARARDTKAVYGCFTRHQESY
eukprot:scaffold99409_cov66-Phaeocystis_antarctica.AAC.1